MPFEPHYTYHTAWAARVLAATRPEKHIDIASSLSFIVNVSAFVPITFYDYRTVPLCLSNVECLAADITSLPFPDNSIASLSSMHAVEHIGLERYGDAFDPQGDLKAMRELARVLGVNGRLLFVVPVSGDARIEYNAHRVYRYAQIIESFSTLALENFSLITDDRQFIERAVEEQANQQRWGCGCFLFRKTPV